MTTDRLTKLLAYANPYAESLPLRPPVGVPAGFIDPAYLGNNVFWQEEGLEERIRRDTAPIPHPDNREGYHGDYHLAFWLGGYRDYRRVLETLHRYGVEPRRVFEFGCATARVLRHFHFQSGSECWGCDFKPSNAEWMMRYLPKAFTVFQNDYYPRLPVEDNHFDAVTAFSVFTHIDETESGWLMELRRILKPGGLAYLSIHDEETWKIKDGDLLATVNGYLPDEVAKSPSLPVGKTVATFRQDDPYRCNVFHSREYIHHVWGRYFDILELLPLRLDKQAIVVGRKR